MFYGSNKMLLKNPLWGVTNFFDHWNETGAKSDAMAVLYLVCNHFKFHFSIFI